MNWATFVLSAFGNVIEVNFGLDDESCRFIIQALLYEPQLPQDLR